KRNGSPTAKARKARADGIQKFASVMWGLARRYAAHALSVTPTTPLIARPYRHATPRNRTRRLLLPRGGATHCLALSDGHDRLREQVRRHWDAETPRDGDGALTLVADVVDRAEEDVRRSPEVVVAFTPDEQQLLARSTEVP